jgi:hypothetical protein
VGLLKCSLWTRPLLSRRTYILMILVYDVRCSKAPYSMYIIVKSFMWSLQMQERTVDSGAFLTMERDDDATAFCFAKA